MTNESQQLILHLLRTIEYRSGRVLGGVDPEYLNYQGPQGIRTPAKILEHMATVLLVLAEHVTNYDHSDEVVGDDPIRQFRNSICVAQRTITSAKLTFQESIKLVQGPLADVLTHIGQLAMLRRMHGSPVPWENYMIPNLGEGTDIDSYRTS